MTVGAPTRTGQSAGYVSGGQQVQVAYHGEGALSGVVQATYVSTPGTFAVGIMAETTLVIDNRIVNASGFAQGDYETTTVVTCF